MTIIFMLPSFFFERKRFFLRGNVRYATAEPPPPTTLSLCRIITLFMFFIRRTIPPIPNKNKKRKGSCMCVWTRYSAAAVPVGWETSQMSKKTKTLEKKKKREPSVSATVEVIHWNVTTKNNNQRKKKGGNILTGTFQESLKTDAVCSAPPRHFYFY